MISQSYLIYTNTFTIFAEDQGPHRGLCCVDLLTQEAQPESKPLATKYLHTKKWGLWSSITKKKLCKQELWLCTTRCATIDN